MRGRRRLTAAAIGAVALTITACSGGSGGGSAVSPPASTPAPAVDRSIELNAVSAGDVVGAMSRAGLSTPNPRDQSGQRCPEIGCTQAIITDAVSVFKFPSSGAAQRYAGSIPDVYQVEDLVVTFPPDLPLQGRRAYEEVVARLLN